MTEMKVVFKKKKIKSHEAIETTLSLMEKNIDDKLANQKVFTPILFTVVTSIIAFLFVNNLGNSAQTVQMYLMVFCYALLCFAILVISLFGKSDYHAIVRRTKKPFRPHRLSSYCYLSDTEFRTRLIIYAGRKLTHTEALTANSIKQKINEYAFKKKCLNVVLGIILAGVLLLGIACMLGIFSVPNMPQYSGGNT